MVSNSLFCEMRVFIYPNKKPKIIHLEIFIGKESKKNIDKRILNNKILFAISFNIFKNYIFVFIS